MSRISRQDIAGGRVSRQDVAGDAFLDYDWRVTRRGAHEVGLDVLGCGYDYSRGEHIFGLSKYTASTASGVQDLASAGQRAIAAGKKLLAKKARGNSRKIGQKAVDVGNNAVAVSKADKPAASSKPAVSKTDKAVSAAATSKSAASQQRTVAPSRQVDRSFQTTRAASQAQQTASRSAASQSAASRSAASQSAASRSAASQSAASRSAASQQAQQPASRSGQTASSASSRSVPTSVTPAAPQRGAVLMHGDVPPPTGIPEFAKEAAETKRAEIMADFADITANACDISDQLDVFASAIPDPFKPVDPTETERIASANDLLLRAWGSADGTVTGLWTSIDVELANGPDFASTWPDKRYGLISWSASAKRFLGTIDQTSKPSSSWAPTPVTPSGDTPPPPDGTTVTAQTTLKADPGPSGTTLQVTSTAGAPFSGAVMVGDEIVLYAFLSPTTFAGCVRGQFGTTASAHPVGTTVSVLQTDMPADQFTQGPGGFDPGTSGGGGGAGGGGGESNFDESFWDDAQDGGSDALRAFREEGVDPFDDQGGGEPLQEERALLEDDEGAYAYDQSDEYATEEDPFAEASERDEMPESETADVDASLLDEDEPLIRGDGYDEIWKSLGKDVEGISTAASGKKAEKRDLANDLLHPLNLVTAAIEAGGDKDEALRRWGLKSAEIPIVPSGGGLVISVPPPKASPEAQAKLRQARKRLLEQRRRAAEMQQAQALAEGVATAPFDQGDVT